MLVIFSLLIITVKVIRKKASYGLVLNGACVQGAYLLAIYFAMIVTTVQQRRPAVIAQFI